MHIGEKIKKLRDERGVTQAFLADNAGIGQPYISKLENQVISNPSPAALGGIANALGIEIMELIEGTNVKVQEGYSKQHIGFCPNEACPGDESVAASGYWKPFKTALVDEDGEIITFCQHCGEALITECWQCGRKIKRLYSYCPGCGASIFHPPKAYNNTTKLKYKDGDIDMGF